MAKRAASAAHPLTPPSTEYTVLARRYRPKQFADLIGQEPVARALVNALKSQRVAHAYLFTGARGVGKTSTARILAKALNCVAGPTPTPCDRCDACEAIARGDDIDVIEIDGASNRGIENIREIRGNVALRPARSRYKIYIIDEVHMLSKDAFNALLKTLEEPPEHVKFIFATTEVQKIPVTILSRCQRFDFAGIGTRRIVDCLKTVVAAERRQIDDDALERIARRAGGSMRDAQSLLDQVLAFAGDQNRPIVGDDVLRLLGMADDDRVAHLAAAALDRDPRAVLELFDQAMDEGVQLGELLDQLLDYWRDLMLVRCIGSEARGLGVSSKHRDALFRQAQSRSLDTILAGLDILAGVKAKLRGSAHGRVLLEMALVRLGRLDDLVPLAELIGQVTNTADLAERRRDQPDALDSARGLLAANAPRAVPPAPENSPASVRPTVANPSPSTVSVPAQVVLDEATLAQVWRNILAQAGKLLAESLKLGGMPTIRPPNTLVLRFALEYNQAWKFCQEPTRAARVEELLSNLTGQSWKFVAELRSDADGAAPPTPSQTESPSSRNREQRARVKQQPLVQWVERVLDARIVHADPEFGSGGVEPSEGIAEPEEQ
jgi:DNA polymerase-3 subunit gamma/tau